MAIEFAGVTQRRENPENVKWLASHFNNEDILHINHSADYP